MKTVKIPLWIEVLARLHPFWICRECMGGGGPTHEVTAWKLLKYWATGRCAVCGKWAKEPTGEVVE